MPRPLLLDSNILARVLRPEISENQPVAIGLCAITTNAMRLATELWAETRAAGQPSSSEESLDVDVILAAQARQVDGCVVTMNEKHFKHIVEVFDRRLYQPA